jgi:hypothetical protein
MTATLNRRAALAVVAAVPAVVALPAVADADRSELRSLIEAHRAAYGAFKEAIDANNALEKRDRCSCPALCGDRAGSN